MNLVSGPSKLPIKSFNIGESIVVCVTKFVQLFLFFNYFGVFVLNAKIEIIKVLNSYELLLFMLL